MPCDQRKVPINIFLINVHISFFEQVQTDEEKKDGDDFDPDEVNQYDESDVSIHMSPAVKKRVRWCSADVTELKRRCGDTLLKIGKVNKENVFRELKGSFLLKKFKFTNIRTRIVYERSQLQ